MGRPNLRLRSEVGKVRQVGQIYRGRWVHVRMVKSEQDRTLISVRKKFGNAVYRNRIRRQIRAICQDIIPQGHPNFLLIIAVGDRSRGVSFADLRLDLHNAFSDLRLI
jgi:ribonuclease P protein component